MSAGCLAGLGLICGIIVILVMCGVIGLAFA
jgi:hypothetical protein